MAREPTLGQFYGIIGPSAEVIGVRVIMMVELPDSQGAGNVQEQEATVTVNALASDTMSDVLARADAYVNSGNLGSRRGKPTSARVLESHGESLYAGGFDDPTIWM